MLFTLRRTKFKVEVKSILIIGRIQMSKDRKFKNESQDARRHDQQHSAHPQDKVKNQDKPRFEVHSNKKK